MYAIKEFFKETASDYKDMFKNDPHQLALRVGCIATLALTVSLIALGVIVVLSAMAAPSFETLEYIRSSGETAVSYQSIAPGAPVDVAHIQNLCIALGVIGGVSLATSLATIFFIEKSPRPARNLTSRILEEKKDPDAKS